jgi:hypothetical protein
MGGENEGDKGRQSERGHDRDDRSQRVVLSRIR